MTRALSDRLRDVGRLLDASRALYEDRARYTAELARTTGLSPEGVELGFASLERDATREDLVAFVAAAGDAERVHVVLSANVFVAPLRAIALARAAAPVVTVRPSSRDPVVARALVALASDPGLTLVEAEPEIPAIATGEIHVYGRKETIASVRGAAAPLVLVRAHGPGLGIAVVTSRVDVRRAAEALAADVVPFEQRGCLSPRVVLVEGDDARAESIAQAVQQSLDRWGARVPQGALSADERAQAARWRDMVSFVGQVMAAPTHVVALAPRPNALLVPPPGRNLLISPRPSLADAFLALSELEPYVVAVGADDPLRVRPFAPPQARLSLLGRMQLPPLDGPVDRRSPARPSPPRGSLTPSSCPG